jgi:hypothetical protein
MNEPNRRAHMLEVYQSENWLKKNSESAKKQWENTDLKARVQKANGKTIKCIETGIIYPSVLEATRHCKMSKYQITRNAQGNKKVEDEFNWEYII